MKKHKCMYYVMYQLGEDWEQLSIGMETQEEAECFAKSNNEEFLYIMKSVDCIHNKKLLESK